MRRIVFFILLSSTVLAVDYPRLTNFVTDTADMIDSVYETKINQLCKEIEENSSVEIAVVTVDSLEGLSREQYAVELFEREGIGKKDRDNGLLILIAKREKEYRVEVGYGLEHIVTDTHKVDIGEGILVPNFRRGEYGKGVYEAILAISGLIEGHDEVLSEYRTGNSDGMPAWVIFIILLIILVIIIMLISVGRNRRSYSRRRGEYGYPIIIPGGGFSGGSGGFGSGGFGGFGGGMSGGGGFGGGW